MSLFWDIDHLLMSLSNTSSHWNDKGKVCGVKLKFNMKLSWQLMSATNLHWLGRAKLKDTISNVNYFRGFEMHFGINYLFGACGVWDKKEHPPDIEWTTVNDSYIFEMAIWFGLIESWHSVEVINRKSIYLLEQM